MTSERLRTWTSRAFVALKTLWIVGLAIKQVKMSRSRKEKRWSRIYHSNTIHHTAQFTTLR